MTEMERQQLWSRKVLELYMKGHFLKALKLLADNDEDRGNVPSMLWALCQERRPADYVFKMKGGTTE